jgi:hypothetical protein
MLVLRRTSVNGALLLMDRSTRILFLLLQTSFRVSASKIVDEGGSCT